MRQRRTPCHKVTKTQNNLKKKLVCLGALVTSYLGLGQNFQWQTRRIIRREAT